VVSWPTSGQKQVIVSVSGPCAYDIDSVSVNVSPCDVRVPNVFTPGSADENSVFAIGEIEKYPNSNLTIFSRWGEVVFYSTNYHNEWTGGKLADGTYFYVLNLA